jgi:hypothetical protein
MLALASAPIPSASTSIVPVVIAVLALFFTIFSFWWLQARKGSVKGFEPPTYAGAASANDFRLRLPVALYNSGARTRVVCRVRLAIDTSPTVTVLSWMTFRTTIKPDTNDVVDFAGPYVIAGRAAEVRFIEFVGDFAGGLPEPRDYTARFEIQMDGAATWLTVCEFVLRLGHMQHPGVYIAYPNSPASDDDVEKTRMALIELARLQHIILAWAPDEKEV